MTQMKKVPLAGGVGGFLRAALGGEDHPICDGVERLSFRPTAQQCRGGKRNDPLNCAAAQCAQKCLNYPTVVLKTVAYINMPVDRQTAAWNRRHNGLKLKVGKNAWHRFTHDRALKAAIRSLDDGGKFSADFYSFLPVTVGGRLTRPKASDTRRQRADNVNQGKPTVRSTHPVDRRRIENLSIVQAA